MRREKRERIKGTKAATPDIFPATFRVERRRYGPSNSVWLTLPGRRAAKVDVLRRIASHYGEVMTGPVYKPEPTGTDVLTTVWFAVKKDGVVWDVKFTPKGR